MAIGVDVLEGVERKARLDAAIEERRLMLIRIEPDALLSMFEDRSDRHIHFHLSGLPAETRVLRATVGSPALYPDTILLLTASPDFDTVPLNAEVPLHYGMISTLHFEEKAERWR